MSDDLVRLTIDALGPEGDGVAQRRGETWYVPGTVPGDVVEAIAEHGAAADGKRGIRRGRVLRVTAPSPQRVEPSCPVARECGGCDWMHVEPEERLRWKQRLLREALGADEAFPVETVRSPERFRRVARFAVGRGRAGAAVGFRHERSRRVVGLQRCPVLEPELSDALGALAGAGEALGAWLAAAGDEVWALSDAARRIVLADGGEAAGEGGRGDPAPRGSRADALRRRREAFARLLDAMPAGLRAASAEARVEAADGGPALRVPPGGFVQANRVVGLELARRVAEAAGPTPGRTVELYAGTGHLTVALLRVTESLLAIESDAAAAQALERNLAERGRADVQARRDDAAAALRGLDGTPELVVADPPRAGLESAAYEIVRLRPRRVLLVSCELRALARDRRVLAREGYAVEQVVLLDMFHPTHHVEALTVFARPGAG